MSRIPPLPIYPVIKSIYSGARVNSGEVALDDSVTNYDIIVIRFKSNAQYMDKFIIAPNTGDFIFEWAIANGTGLQNEPFYYKNVSNISIPSDTTKINVTNAHNNANLVVGVVNVYGIKLVDSIE